MRTRIAGIIIRNGKILLVRAKNYMELWTPGGTPLKNETPTVCLKRELKEEINADLRKMKFLGEFIEISPYTHKEVRNVIYMVDVEGDLKPQNEIEELVWVSREDFENKRYNYVYIIEDEIIPTIIKKKLF